MNSQQIIEWLRRLVSFDTRVFEEVRSNPSATIPGLAFVTIAIFLSGLGGFLWWVVEDFQFAERRDILIHSTLIGSLIAIVLWGLAWLGIVYVMLTQVFRERAYVEQLLRVMGLAATPLALSGLMFIPEISLGIGLTSLALTFGLTGIAIQSVTTAGPGPRPRRQCLRLPGLGRRAGAARLHEYLRREAKRARRLPLQHDGGYQQRPVLQRIGERSTRHLRRW